MTNGEVSSKKALKKVDPHTCMWIACTAVAVAIRVMVFVMTLTFCCIFTPSCFIDTLLRQTHAAVFTADLSMLRFGFDVCPRLDENLCSEGAMKFFMLKYKSSAINSYTF